MAQRSLEQKREIVADARLDEARISGANVDASLDLAMTQIHASRIEHATAMLSNETLSPTQRKTVKSIVKYGTGGGTESV